MLLGEAEERSVVVVSTLYLYIQVLYLQKGTEKLQIFGLRSSSKVDLLDNFWGLGYIHNLLHMSPRIRSKQRRPGGS